MKLAIQNAVLMVLSLLTINETAAAHGAIAFSFHPDTVDFVVAAEWNQPTMLIAEDRAMAACRRKGGRSCGVIRQVSGNCVAVAITNEGLYRVATGDSQIEAQGNSIAACLARNPGDSCIVRKSFCDNSTTSIYACRNEDSYDACMIQGRPGFGGATERRQYCRMAFC